MTSRANMNKNNRAYYQRHKEEILARRKAKREENKKYKDQLTKAKEIIKDLMSFSVQLCDCRHTIDFEKTREQAEQFLNSENIILEDAQAGNSPFDADEVFNKEMKAYPEGKVK